MRGKTGNIKKLAERSQRDPTKFGDLVTVDHEHVRDKMSRGGTGGFAGSFTMLDVGTGCKCSIPVDALDAMETTRAVQYVLGDQAGSRVYSGNHRSIRKACHMLRIWWKHHRQEYIKKCQGGAMQP